MKWVSEGADMEAFGRGCVQCRDRNLNDCALYVSMFPAVEVLSEFLDDKSCQVTIPHDSLRLDSKQEFYIAEI